MRVLTLIVIKNFMHTSLHRFPQPDFRDSFHIQIFNARVLTTGTEWNIPDVKSSFWRLYRNAENGSWIENNNRNYKLDANELLLIPADIHFHCCNRQPVQHFFAHFDVLGIPSSLLRPLFPQPIYVPQQPDLQLAIASLTSLLVQTPQLALSLALQMRVKALIYTALATYLDHNTSVRERLQHLHAEQAPVAPALRFIEENLAQPLSNRELANRCHLSEDYFIRRFRECVGQSPTQYIRERRLAIATQRLLFSQDSIEKIAITTGFGNRYYFSRVFAQHLKTSPAAYRKQSQV